MRTATGWDRCIIMSASGRAASGSRVKFTVVCGEAFTGAAVGHGALKFCMVLCMLIIKRRREEEVAVVVLCLQEPLT